MPRRIARCLLIIALLFSIGGHWMLVQSAAWAGMMVSYAKTASLATALSKTFDGRHPCKLCKAVDQGSKPGNGSNRPAPDTLKKIELFVESVSMCLRPQLCQTLEASEPSVVILSRTLTPPIPPPRLV